MSQQQFYTNYFNNVTETLNTLDHASLNSIIEAILEVYHNKGTIYIFGNGGSGATASHIAGDFVKGVSYGLEKRFKMICLSDNTPGVSAISNDVSYEDIFVEQLKNFLEPHDMAIGLSGSGNSENVMRALNYAKEKGAKTAALCGFSGGKAKETVDHCLYAKIDDMEIAEDIHMIALHVIKQSIIKELGKEGKSMGMKYDERV
ncbi:MAG: SIS domain-containing protein [Flavobacteriales bacterium]